MPQILYNNNGLLVIDKPAGLLSQPGRRPEKWDSVITRLKAHYPDAVVVHRLDEPTSGLMMLALGQAMSSGLSRAFRERQVHKRYEAIVDGLMTDDQGSIDFPLIADWPNRPRQKIDFETGKPSLTHFQVMARHVQENWTIPSAADASDDARPSYPGRSLVRASGSIGPRATDVSPCATSIIRPSANG